MFRFSIELDNLSYSFGDWIELLWLCSLLSSSLLVAQLLFRHCFLFNRTALLWAKRKLPASYDWKPNKPWSLKRSETEKYKAKCGYLSILFEDQRSKSEQFWIEIRRKILMIKESICFQSESQRSLTKEYYHFKQAAGYGCTRTEKQWMWR